MGENTYTYTYTGRDRVLRFANRVAKVGTSVTVSFDDFNGGAVVRSGLVAEVTPGAFVPTVIVRFFNGETAEITSDLYNNLTDYRVLRVERHVTR
mgnify:CR=1 FL=1